MYKFDFNRVDLNYLLEKCGFVPEYTRGDSSWYKSPFREEMTASFQVRGNLFTDWGDPDCKGGILDLCARLFDIPRENTRDLIENLKSVYGINDFSIPYSQYNETKKREEIEHKPEKVVASYPMNNPRLIEYLEERGVLASVAQRFTNVIVYLNSEKNKRLFGIGFPNQSGGYELRSQYSKRSFYPKDISILPTSESNDKQFAVVFEGFMDALSYLSQKIRSGQIINFDCVVLNGVGMVERSIPKLKEYQMVYGLLDNDDAGKKCTQTLAKSLDNFIDSRAWLGEFKDVNDKIISMLRNELDLSKKAGVSQKQNRHRF